MQSAAMSGSQKKVSQADLRKLMSGSINKSGGASSATSSKRYKVSGRELALIEEQKRIKLAEKERKAAKASAAAAALAATLPPTDAKPVKSILKNKASSAAPLQPQLSSTIKTPSSRILAAAPSTHPSAPPSATPASSLTTASPAAKSIDLNQADEGQPEAEDGKTPLPEGFFDDPVMDAKARGVQYVDKEEEEWEAFQKEIEAEANVAQNILVEDRNEATVDRQIEEIDDQIQAWQRVNRLEKLKDEVESKLKPAKAQDKTEKALSDEESDDDLDDMQDFVDWRNKC